MLVIEVTFLTGRYVATAHHSRTSSEWPPHPARLYSALAAAHFEAEVERPEERRALEWLERAPPPEIAASAASERTSTTVYVPVNDTGVVRGLARQEERLLEAEAVEAEQEVGGGTRPRRSSAVERTRAAVRARLADAVRAPDRLHEHDARRARAALPETRPRQARSFPSVTPDEPSVTYVWTTSPPDAVRRALAVLVERVVRLGHSSSLVHLRLLDEAPATRFRPSREGSLVLRVVEPGQLQRLESAHRLHRETESRVLSCGHVHYDEFDGIRPLEQDDAKPQPAALFSEQWIVLRCVELAGAPPSARLPMSAAVGLARAVRGALMHHAEEPIPTVLSGHEPDGTPTPDDHLAFVPLPLVADHPARGSLRGVALVLPRGNSQEDRRSVARALRRWEAEAGQGDEAVDGEVPPCVPVMLGRAGVLHLRRTDGEESGTTLDPRTWCAPSTTWLTATPIALDRHPGKLWSRDRAERRAAERSACESIAKSCERIGLPRPVRIEVLARAPLAGTLAARLYPEFPASRARGTPRRMLTHARVVFSEPVRGPLLIGAGRYFGLGLLRPVGPER